MVRMWSGVAAPAAEAARARSDPTNSSTSGVSVYSATTCFSPLSAPRMTGAMAAATVRRTSSSSRKRGSATNTGSDVRDSTCALASATSSRWRSYASSGVAPQVTAPWLRRMSPSASGRSRTAAPTSFESRKPGRR